MIRKYDSLSHTPTLRDIEPILARLGTVYSSEKEVVAPARTRFAYLGKGQDFNGKTVLHMVELNCDPTPGFVHMDHVDFADHTPPKFRDPTPEEKREIERLKRQREARKTDLAPENPPPPADQ